MDITDVWYEEYDTADKANARMDELLLLGKVFTFHSRMQDGGRVYVVRWEDRQ